MGQLKKNGSNFSNVDREHVLDFMIVNEKWGRFKRLRLHAQCKFIPKVQKSKLRKQSSQWMNKATCKSLQKNYKLSKIYERQHRVIKVNIVICVLRLKT